MLEIVHYRDDIYDTSGACGNATPDDEWTTDPQLVTCLACELSDIMAKHHASYA